MRSEAGRLEPPAPLRIPGQAGARPEALPGALPGSLPGALPGAPPGPATPSLGPALPWRPDPPTRAPASRPASRPSALSRLAGGLAEGLAEAVYPSACLGCGDVTAGPHGLCGACWREAGLLWGPAAGLVCDVCGAPLVGEEPEAGPGAEPDARSPIPGPIPGPVPCPVPCDDCLRTPRPWTRGRAALPYRGPGRDLVLRLKHGDRPDLARPLGRWIAQAARPLLTADLVVVPVPLHWSRLLRRRYNQAALLARAAGAAMGRPVLPDALQRRRRTQPLGALGPEAREAALQGAIEPHPRHGARLRGRCVLLVDDVLTTGATLAAAAEAARDAGAREVRVAVLARASHEP